MSSKTAVPPPACQTADAPPGTCTGSSPRARAAGALGPVYNAAAGRRLRFAGGVPGFPNAKTFRAAPWGPQPNPFLLLECEELAGLRFVAVPPRVFFPSYAPAFGPEVYQAIEASGAEEVELLVILTLQRRPEDTTANLLGPVVVNADSGDAVQAVLSGSGLSPRAPLFPNLVS